MQNLLRLILRYSNFLLFLLLEVVALLWMASEQKLQQSTFLSASNGAIAWLNTLLSDTDEYFHLRGENADLAAENARLHEELNRMQGLTETSIERDSAYLYAHLQWSYTPAKVVDMATETQHNYLVLNKGSRDGIETGQGVIAHDGVVGVVGAVNSHFAQVVPIIHPKMRLSCRLRSNSQTGFLEWKGPSSRYATLTDIGRHIEVKKGDWVETSGLTGLFPEGIPIGTVDEIMLPEGDTYYSIRVELATDFKCLRYVQLLHNQTVALQDSMRMKR